MGNKQQNKTNELKDIHSKHLGPCPPVNSRLGHSADGRWFDDCHVAYFDGDDLVVDDHCDPAGDLRLTNWEPDTLTMQELAGHYVWKHDGQHSNGDMTLHEDGTLDQYWPGLRGSTWYISDNDEVVLSWPWDHVLTRDPNSNDWFMNSRNPPSKLEWVGPIEAQCPYSNETVVC